MLTHGTHDKIAPSLYLRNAGRQAGTSAKRSNEKKKTLAEKKKQAYALLVVFDDCLMKSYLPGYDEMHVLQWQ